MKVPEKEVKGSGAWGGEEEAVSGTRIRVDTGGYCGRGVVKLVFPRRVME